LHHGIDEMRRADHHTVDRAARHLGMAAQEIEHGNDAAGHIFRRRRLDRMHDASVFEQHRIGIGAADIDPDAPHGCWNTERKSRSYPKARGPTCSSPFGVRKTGGAGRATTVTRMPYRIVSVPAALPETVSRTQIRSGDIAIGVPSCQGTTHSFWNAISSRL